MGSPRAWPSWRERWGRHDEPQMFTGSIQDLNVFIFYVGRILVEKSSAD